MSNSVVRSAKNTHYAVSTFAAVVYAVVWLLANRAHADTLATQAMPAIIVTAHREAPKADMPEIIVWGKREVAAPAAMEEVIVWGKRESSASDMHLTSVASTTNVAGTNAKSSGGWALKARHWLQTALLK